MAARHAHAPPASRGELHSFLPPAPLGEFHARREDDSNQSSATRAWYNSARAPCGDVDYRSEYSSTMMPVGSPTLNNTSISLPQPHASPNVWTRADTPTRCLTLCRSESHNNHKARHIVFAILSAKSCRNRSSRTESRNCCLIFDLF